MAYDGWLEYNGVELVNLSRTTQLADALGIDAVWVSPPQVAWIETALGGVDYDVPTTAPWYDAGYPASAEFAGIVPLGFPGLDDSTMSAETIEYITDGGKTGKQRSSTLPIVGSVAIIASTERGAEFGKRWMDKVLSGAGAGSFCAGVELRYFRYADAAAPIMHRRDVRCSRGASVTRKRNAECASTWWATFTLTCDDPYEYGDPVVKVTGLGSTAAPTGSVISHGSLVLTQESCPVYDYSPLYDPLYPALVPSPTAPEFYPAGWDIAEGMTFERFWARVSPLEPSMLRAVPLIKLDTLTEARMVRVSIWPSDSLTDDQCGPLFSAVVSYLPPNMEFYIDGEQQAAFVMNSLGVPRRTDSLVYSPDAKPVEWTAFNDTTDLLVTLDLFAESGDYEGGGDVRMELSLIPKSD